MLRFIPFTRALPLNVMDPLTLEPAAGLPDKMFRIEVLPPPLGPRIARTSPGFTSPDTPLSTCSISSPFVLPVLVTATW
jgi:hypothetical protein